MQQLVQENCAPLKADEVEKRRIMGRSSCSEASAAPNSAVIMIEMQVDPNVITRRALMSSLATLLVFLICSHVQTCHSLVVTAASWTAAAFLYISDHLAGEELCRPAHCANADAAEWKKHVILFPSPPHRSPLLRRCAAIFILTNLLP